MSAKQSSYDDFDITTPRNQPTQQLMLGELTQSSAALELYNSHVKAFLHLKTNGASLERLNLKVKLLSPWHDSSELIPTMNFNAPHNTPN